MDANVNCLQIPVLVITIVMFETIDWEQTQAMSTPRRGDLASCNFFHQVKKMKNYIILLMLFTVVVSCSSRNEEAAEMSLSEYAPVSAMSSRVAPEGKMMAADSDLAAPTNKFLAYEHSLTVSVAHENLKARYEALNKRCLEDKAFSCVLLNSEIRGGNYASASLTMRIKPEGVQAFLDMASENAEITNQSTRADDLTDRVMDVEKRLQQLRSYRDKLIELEAKSADEVDALIRISGELSRTQTQLEYAEGEKLTLYKRIESDILNIYLQSDREESTFYPLVQALSNFGENLAEGVAQFITAFAYLLPWLLFLIALIWLLRFLWKRRKQNV